MSRGATNAAALAGPPGGPGGWDHPPKLLKAAEKVRKRDSRLELYGYVMGVFPAYDHWKLRRLTPLQLILIFHEAARERERIYVREARAALLGTGDRSKAYQALEGIERSWEE
jgi:hypothetical protein